MIKAKAECYELYSPNNDGLPRGYGTSDPTVDKAIRASRLGKNIELIEQCVIEAAPDVYQWLLKAVTEDVPWDILRPPCGINQFCKKRRKFFFLLDKKKW
jgi:hypothetical protein